jgi:hypothetical protein
MKEALIDPRVNVYKYDKTLLGKRVCEVTSTSFVVAEPLFWVACNDDVVADQWYYDTTTYAIDPIPAPPPPPPKAPVEGPTVI